MLITCLTLSSNKCTLDENQYSSLANFLWRRLAVRKKKIQNLLISTMTHLYNLFLTAPSTLLSQFHLQVRNRLCCITPFQFIRCSNNIGKRLVSDLHGATACCNIVILWYHQRFVVTSTLGGSMVALRACKYSQLRNVWRMSGPYLC
jgi:hypothetical protein